MLAADSSAAGVPVQGLPNRTAVPACPLGRVRRAPEPASVLDRYERPVGVVSLADVAVDTCSDLLDWETLVKEIPELVSP